MEKSKTNISIYAFVVKKHIYNELYESKRSSV